MNGVRRSTRLSSSGSSSNPITPSTPRRQIWRQKYNEDLETDSESEMENRENCNSANRAKQKEKTVKMAEQRTPKTAKPLRPMPACRKRELLSKRTLKPCKDDAATSSDDEAIVNVKQVSPPKQARMQKAIVEAQLISPSRLIDRLSIDDKSESSSENGASTEKLTTNRNKYQNARRVLNSAETNLLPGREKELDELQTYFTDHLANNKSGSLYVSGPPGTGKTACLSKLLKCENFSSKFHKVYINCTSISTISSIYKKICAELSIEVQGRTEKDHLTAVRQYLCSTKNQKRKLVLMVLDEIDQLCGQKQSVLYTIFEWPALPGSRLLLIGIANSLDLTDRLLARLNAKCELKPRLMHFSPYTKQQIVDIFKSRLEEAGVQEIFPAVTLQLLAAKVSAVSGDVRRALDIGRRVVEIAEQQKRNPATTSGNDKSQLNLDDLDLETNDAEEQLKPVQVTQVMTVLNKVYGASQRLDKDMEESFPLQQKIMLCSLMLMLCKEKNKDITMGRLHEVYRRVCDKRNIHYLDQAEFVGVVDLVETRGIVRIVRKKEPRLHRVLLQWDEEEVNAALSDKQLIASILDDISCLTR